MYQFPLWVSDKVVPTLGPTEKVNAPRDGFLREVELEGREPRIRSVVFLPGAGPVE